MNHSNTQMPNSTLFGNNQKPIKILKLLMVPTRRHYMDVFKRSFELNATPDNVHKLTNLLDQYVGMYGKVTETGIANVIPNMFKISHNADGKANIINGWGVQRLRFILITSTPAFDGVNEEISCFQGYTEYYDPSFNGNIDDNMRFFINTITNMTKMFDPATKAYRVLVRGTHNLISDKEVQYGYGQNHHSDKLVRPMDLIQNMSIQESVGAIVNSNNFLNTSDNVDNTVKVSSRSNSNPLRHFTKTINAYTSGRATIDKITVNNGDVLNSAMNTVTEFNPLRNELMERLKHITGVLTPSSFSLNELTMIDPNLGYNTTLVSHEQMVVNNNDIFGNTNILETENTSSTFGVSTEAVIAANIQHSLSGLMVENMLSSIVFTCTNMNHGNEVVSMPINGGSFIDGLDPQALIAKTIMNFESTVMPEITNGNLIPLNVTITADILGDTTIAIMIGGTGQPEVFRYPTFADSLFTPVIANQNTSKIIIDDMHTVFDLVNIHNAQNEMLHY